MDGRDYVWSLKYPVCIGSHNIIGSIVADCFWHCGIMGFGSGRSLSSADKMTVMGNKLFIMSESITCEISIHHELLLHAHTSVVYSKMCYKW